jgi:hypothetical protein
MKKLLIFVIMLSFVMAACNRSTCPTFDKANDGGTGGSKGKSKSGLFPNKM